MFRLEENGGSFGKQGMVGWFIGDENRHLDNRIPKGALMFPKVPQSSLPESLRTLQLEKPHGFFGFYSFNLINQPRTWRIIPVFQVVRITPICSFDGIFTPSD